MHKRVDLSRLEWFHEPQLSIQSADKLVIETEPYSSLSSFQQEELLAFGTADRRMTEFTVTVKMSYQFREPQDECGIVIRLNDERWEKFGVALKNREVAEIICTRYSHGLIDKSMREIGSGIIVLYLKAHYNHGSVAFAYSMNGKKYTDFRSTQFVDDEREAQYCLYACSPGNSYFDVTFSGLELETVEEEKE